MRLVKRTSVGISPNLSVRVADYLVHALYCGGLLTFYLLYVFPTVDWSSTYLYLSALCARNIFLVNIDCFLDVLYVCCNPRATNYVRIGSPPLWCVFPTT